MPMARLGRLFDQLKTPCAWLVSIAREGCPANLRTSSTAGVLPARQGQETALGSRKSHPSHGRGQRAGLFAARHGKHTEAMHVCNTMHSFTLADPRFGLLMKRGQNSLLPT